MAHLEYTAKEVRLELELVQLVLAVQAELERHFAVLFAGVAVLDCIEHQAHLRMVDIDLVQQIDPVVAAEMVAAESVAHMAVVRLDIEVLLAHLKSNKSISFNANNNKHLDLHSSEYLPAAFG